jgi:predicted secreted Zn-dependent protease
MKTALFVLVLLLMPVVSHADPKETVKYDYYDIHGHTVDQLRLDMNSKDIVDRNGRRNDAFTTWDVDWKFNYKTNETGRCALTSVHVTVAVTYRLPRWTDSSAASDEIRRHWDRYMAALLTHERGHENFGVSAAKDVEAAIIALKPQDDCTILDQKANAAGHKAVDKYVAQEIVYDIETNHGATQGAIFP